MLPLYLSRVRIPVKVLKGRLRQWRLPKSSLVDITDMMGAPSKADQSDEVA